MRLKLCKTTIYTNAIQFKPFVGSIAIQVECSTEENEPYIGNGLKINSHMKLKMNYTEISQISQLQWYRKQVNWLKNSCSQW